MRDDPKRSEKKSKTAQKGLTATQSGVNAAAAAMPQPQPWPQHTPAAAVAAAMAVAAGLSIWTLR